AVCCTMLVSRFSKPRRRLIMSNAWSDYEVAIWVRCGKRASASPMLMIFRGIYCQRRICGHPSRQHLTILSVGNYDDINWLAPPTSLC
uniref:Uncharacterized protein n=1 Tax=Parascaris univalens TaxID=6257 RepID=A0A914ZW70_PARUN